MNYPVISTGSRILQANSATAAFIVKRPRTSEGTGSDLEDSSYRDLRTILTALSLKNFTQRENPDLKIYAQILTPSHKEIALDRGIDYIVCTAELKMSTYSDFMSRMCLSNDQGCITQAVLHTGLSTLLTNLITSVTARPKDHYTLNTWLNDYEYVQQLCTFWLELIVTWF